MLRNKHEGGTFYLSRTQEQEFEKKNRYDFELYEYAVQLSKISCANGPKDYHPVSIYCTSVFFRVWKDFEIDQDSQSSIRIERIRPFASIYPPPDFYQIFLDNFRNLGKFSKMISKM